MAQAARLNLRMQKELKLLLTDPPPFASFPLLSPNSDLSTFSLSSILAHIEGPEDTVYAKGVFKINIQIPERYPFQPPIVTFATPIYHPNIDTGGRICLDILNLPPKGAYKLKFEHCSKEFNFVEHCQNGLRLFLPAKHLLDSGAWQPSLNISTVLTSILLLLSEPNPDDGLMCEASKEYKYNRQAFDQKARSMTERYARNGATENGSSSQNTEIHLNLSMMETEGSELSKFPAHELLGTDKMLSPRKKKLLLDSSVTNKKKDNDNEANEGLLQNQIEIKVPKRQPTEMLDDYQKHEKFQNTRRKLSLESVGLHQKRTESQKENILNPRKSPMVASESLLEHQDINQNEQQSHQQLHKTDDTKSVCDAAISQPKKLSLKDNLRTVGQLSPANSVTKLSFSPLPAPMKTSPSDKQHQKNSVDRTGSGFTSIKHKRLGLAGRKQSSGLSTSLQSRDKDRKENMVTLSSVPLSNLDSGESSHGKVCNFNSNVASKKLLGIRRRQPLEPLDKSNGTNDGNVQLNLRADNPDGTPCKSFSVAVEERHSWKQLQQDNITTFAGQMKNQGDVSPTLDSVIVLDSEDSDEDKERTTRPKLSLVRKRLIGKRNVRA